MACIQCNADVVFALDKLQGLPYTICQLCFRDGARMEEVGRCECNGTCGIDISGASSQSWK